MRLQMGKGKKWTFSFHVSAYLVSESMSFSAALTYHSVSLSGLEGIEFLKQIPPQVTFTTVQPLPRPRPRATSPLTCLMAHSSFPQEKTMTMKGTMRQKTNRQMMQDMLLAVLAVHSTEQVVPGPSGPQLLQPKRGGRVQIREQTQDSTMPSEALQQLEASASVGVIMVLQRSQERTAKEISDTMPEGQRGQTHITHSKQTQRA